MGSTNEPHVSPNAPLSPYCGDSCPGYTCSNHYGVTVNNPPDSLDAQREDNPDKLWAMIRERDIQIAKYKRSFEVVELLVRLLKENIDDARN